MPSLSSFKWRAAGGVGGHQELGHQKGSAGGTELGSPAFWRGALWYNGVPPAVQMVPIHLAPLPSPLLPETAARGAAARRCAKCCPHSGFGYAVGSRAPRFLGARWRLSGFGGNRAQDAAVCLRQGGPSVPRTFSLRGGGSLSVGPGFQLRPWSRSVFQASVHPLWVFALYLLSALW